MFLQVIQVARKREWHTVNKLPSSIHSRRRAVKKFLRANLFENLYSLSFDDVAIKYVKAKSACMLQLTHNPPFEIINKHLRIYKHGTYFSVRHLSSLKLLHFLLQANMAQKIHINFTRTGREREIRARHKHFYWKSDTKKNKKWKKVLWQMESRAEHSLNFMRH